MKDLPQLVLSFGLNIYPFLFGENFHIESAKHHPDSDSVWWSEGDELPLSDAVLGEELLEFCVGFEILSDTL